MRLCIICIIEDSSMDLHENDVTTDNKIHLIFFLYRENLLFLNHRDFPPSIGLSFVKN